MHPVWVQEDLPIDHQHLAVTGCRTVEIGANYRVPTCPLAEKRWRCSIVKTEP